VEVSALGGGSAAETAKPPIKDEWEPLADAWRNLNDWLQSDLNSHVTDNSAVAVEASQLSMLWRKLSELFGKRKSQSAEKHSTQTNSSKGVDGAVERTHSSGEHRSTIQTTAALPGRKMSGPTVQESKTTDQPSTDRRLDSTEQNLMPGEPQSTS